MQQNNFIQRKLSPVMAFLIVMLKIILRDNCVRAQWAAAGFDCHHVFVKRMQCGEGTELNGVRTLAVCSQQIIHQIPRGETRIFCRSPVK
jgi:hypothetical protein